MRLSPLRDRKVSCSSRDLLCAVNFTRIRSVSALSSAFHPDVNLAFRSLASSGRFIRAETGGGRREVKGRNSSSVQFSKQLNIQNIT